MTHFRYNIISVIFQTYICLFQVWAPKSSVTYNSLTMFKDVKEEERLNPIRLFIECPRQGCSCSLGVQLGVKMLGKH